MLFTTKEIIIVVFGPATHLCPFSEICSGETCSVANLDWEIQAQLEGLILKVVHRQTYRLSCIVHHRHVCPL